MQISLAQLYPMKIMNYFCLRTLLSLILTVILLRCSSSDSSIAGGSTDTETGAISAVGIVIDPMGARVSGVQISSYPQNYDPIRDQASLAVAMDTTNVYGEFKLAVTKSGTYSLYAINLHNGDRALRNKVILDQKVVNLNSLTITKPGSLLLSVPEGLITQDGYCYIPGTNISLSVSHNQKLISIDTLPSAVIPYLIFQSNQANSFQTILDSTFAIESGERTYLHAYRNWDKQASITLNTTSSGANIQDTIVEFPLLLRLDSNQVVFSDATTDGSDIRFINQAGRFLPFEIEEWNKAQKSALVWVLVDTIYGNTSKTSLSMLWGASALQLPESAFEKETSFSGVWHFKETNDSNLILDASAKHNHGANFGTISRDGIIGKGRYFDGASYISVTDNPSLETASITLSAWVRRDGIQDSLSKIVHKGPNDSAFESYGLEFRNRQDIAGFQISKIDSTYRTLSSSREIVDAEWMYLAGTFDAKSGVGSFYVNGKQRSTFVDTLPIAYYTSRQWNLTFGSQNASAPFFKGYLDEVQLSSQARSADWIKLMFENQRLNSNFVEFKRKP